MKIKKITLLLIVAGMTICAGCHTESFREKWPKYPDWNWWNHPAGQQAEEPAETVPEKSVPSQKRPDLSKPAESVKSQYPSIPITDPQLLAEYRQSIWPEAKQLRNLNEIPAEQRREYVAHTIRMLPRWYAPLSVAPPDTHDPDWTTVVIWDFLPEQEFSRAAEAYGKIAGQQNLPFPKHVTRRELMQFILRLTGGADKSSQKQPLVPMKPKKEF